LVKKSLRELIRKNFIEISRKRLRKSPLKRKISNRSKNTLKFSLSSILISSALKEVSDQDGKIDDSEKESWEAPKDEPKIEHGGYGTVSKDYGLSGTAKYTDYSKLWSHLGSFKTQNMYADTESSNQIAMNNGESTREAVSTETIEKAAKHFKYFVSGDIVGDIGFVPPTGSNINSKDWEKYRLMSMMSIYKPLLLLKTTTA